MLLQISVDLSFKYKFASYFNKLKIWKYTLLRM